VHLPDGISPRPSILPDDADMSPSLARAALIAAALPLLAAAAPARPAAPPPYRVSLRAKLFYSNSGEFSRDILSGKRPDLWNTIVGEGQAGGASSELLVIAVVSGEGGSYVPERKVELTATTNGHVAFQRAEETPIITTEGKAYVAFWLYGVGCKRLRLSARVTGQTPATAPATAMIPFDCGE
jgi:DNA-binding transcriptional LysR family regulator